MATKHNHQVIFGQREADCPRCAELADGATPRTGYRRTRRYSGTGSAKDRTEQRRAQVAAHFAPDGPHARGECGPVCTAFDA